MCSLSMYNHNRVTVNAADSLLDGGIHLKEAKKSASISWHDLSNDTWWGNRSYEMNRANRCSASRKETQMGKVICQMLYSKSAVPGFQIEPSNSKAHEHAKVSLHE